MFCKTKKEASYTILVLLISVILSAVLLCAVLSVTTLTDVPTAEAAEGDMIYWGVKEDNRLIISTNESDVSSYAVDGQRGSFASDTNFTIALIPWNSYKSTITDIQVKSGVKPKSTGYWFEGCSNATSFDLSGLDTSSVTNMTNMFKNCSKIESLDLSYFNTASVERMFEMFSGCSALKTIELTSFNTRKTVNFDSMFNGCNTLESLDLSKFEIVGFLTTVSGMLEGCSNLETIVLPTTIERGFNLPGRFWYDGNDIDIWIPANTELAGKTLFRHDPHNYVDGVCSLCGDSQPIYWGISDDKELVISSDEVYVNSKVNSDKKGSFASNSLDVPWQSYLSDGICKVTVGGGTIYPVSLKNWFSNGWEVTTFDLSGLNTSRVVNMDGMFKGCVVLTTLHLDHFDNSKVTSMVEMFAACEALSEITFSDKFVTSSVINTSGMFYNNSALTTIDMSSFDMSNVTDCSQMFDGCSNATTIYAPNKIGNATLVLPTEYWTGLLDTSDNIITVTSVTKDTAIKTENGKKKLLRHNGHDLTSHEKKSATCTEDGEDAHFVCKICGKYYLDRECTQETTAAGVVEAKLGHSFGTPTYSWNELECTAERICTRDNCGHKETETVTAALTETQPAICTQTGTETYTATFENDNFSVQTKEKELSELGHDYGEWEVTKQATCTEEGSRKHICKRDGHIATETIAKIAHTVVTDAAVAPTCTEAGKTAGKHCSVCDTVLVVQTTVEALGHDFGEWTVTKEPTADEYGEEQRVCSHDGTHVEKRQIEKLPASQSQIDWKWIIILIVLAVVVLGEISYLIYHRVRKNRDAEDVEQ